MDRGESMKEIQLKEGDILQISPIHPKFPGFFLIVTEPKSWGAQGFLVSSRNFEAVKFKGRAFLRVKFEEVEYCGKVYWIEKENEDGTETL